MPPRFSRIALLSLPVLAVVSCAPPPKALYVPKTMAGGVALVVKPPVGTTPAVVKSENESPAPEAEVVKKAPAPATVVGETLPPPAKKGFFARLFGPQPKKQRDELPAAEVAMVPPAPMPVVEETPPVPAKKGFFARLFGPKEKKMGLADVDPLPAANPAVPKVAVAAAAVKPPPADGVIPADVPKVPKKPLPARESGDGLRLPDMLTMPGENDLRKSTAPAVDGGASVIAKPPAKNE